MSDWHAIRVQASTLANTTAIPQTRGAARFRLPRVAIGGITPDNAPALVAAGADLVAVISGVYDAPDPVAAARAYAACFPRTG